jgi:hypothetical protein
MWQLMSYRKQRKAGLVKACISGLIDQKLNRGWAAVKACRIHGLIFVSLSLVSLWTTEFGKRTNAAQLQFARCF